MDTDNFQTIDIIVPYVDIIGHVSQFYENPYDIA